MTKIVPGRVGFLHGSLSKNPAIVPDILNTLFAIGLVITAPIDGMNMPVDVQIAFTGGITTVFLLSSLLTVPAIVVSAMRGRDERIAVPSPAPAE